MDKERTMKTRSRRKRTTGTLMAVLAVLILMAGTFAWYYVTNALNEFTNIDENSAVLHDDFEKEGKEENDTLVHNKDVYVENTGDNELYIRIKLDEYMELDGNSLIAGADINDMTTWHTHKPHSTDPADPVDATADPFHDYWQWTMGGSTEYVPNLPGAKGVVSRYDSNGNDTLVAGDLGNETTPTATVITMAAYTAMSDTNKAAFVGWVYDTDGYAYWSQKLAPGEATGLLLDEVTLKSIFGDDEEYYYAINVILETVDEADLDAWLTSSNTKAGDETDQASKDAGDMLKDLSGNYEKITSDMIKEADDLGLDMDDYDLDGDGYLSEEELAAYEKAVEEAKAAKEAARKATTLVSIEVTQNPTVTHYNGDELDLTGMEITATYEDGHEKTNITSGFTVSSTIRSTGVILKVGENTIYVYYTETNSEGEEISVSTVMSVTVLSDAQRTIKNATVGGTVTLSGREWIVLSKDETAGTAELLSMNIVANRLRDTEAKVQNGTGEGGWENSDLREWLNGTETYEGDENFYDNMLDDDIKAIIVPTTKITNRPTVDYTTVDETDFDNLDDSKAQVTTDNVYLLSMAEYQNYENTYSGDLYAAGLDSGVDAFSWWLRSPSTSSAHVWNVRIANGTVVEYYVPDDHGVRPALTVSYK